MSCYIWWRHLANVIERPTTCIHEQCALSSVHGSDRSAVCEQLPGANSSLIVTELRQSYPWPQGTRSLNLGRSRSKVKVSVLELF